MTSELSELKAIKEKYSQMLLSLPNVTGIAVGRKKSSGCETGPLAIQVFVSHKVPVDQLPESDVVPPELDGCPTDVVVMPELTARMER